MSVVRKKILFAFCWYSELLHSGAQRYCVEQGWSSAVLNENNAALFPEGSYDAILSALSGKDHPAYTFVDRAKVPVVELSRSHPEQTAWGRYPSDGEAVGRIAVDYLRRRPVTSFAFVAPNHWSSHMGRKKGFLEALEKSDDRRPVESFHMADAGAVHMDRHSVSGDTSVSEALATFLRNLPKPAGVFASGDELAGPVLEAADRAGLKIPGDLYLLAFGSRDLLSRLSPIPISTIAIDHEAWGYAAMGFLHEMMDGKTPPGTVRLFPPGAVIERESSGGEAGGEPLCERALEIMRAHVADPLEVPEIAAQLGVSRSKLTQVFAEVTGTSPAKRYLALRMEVAKGLLLSGEKVESVAVSIGFSSARSFRAAFQESTGMAPREFVEKSKPAK